MLTDTFYYCEFEYPTKSGIWYKGSHPHLITKEMYLKVQQQRSVPPKVKWGSKKILFRGVFRCAACNGMVTGEEKFRERKVGEPRHHVYYHCGRSKDPSCKEPFLTEEELIKSLLQFINFMSIAHPQTIEPTSKLKMSMESYNQIREETLIRQNINPKGSELTFLEYAQYILRSGTNEEKLELTKTFGKQLYIHNKEICGSPLRKFTQ